jgi:3-oxoacyl-[acyl-carrier protein] reductase
MFDLTGNAAIVTGGARGIGRAIALALAEAGADVLITYKGNAAAADAVVAEIAAKGRTGVSLKADAADPDSAAAVVAQAMERFGKVDLLVNNAGITRDTLIMRMSAEQWREVLDTNLSGAFYMTKAVVKEMLRAKSGRIINITSVSGQAGNAGQANYSSAKAGMIGLTKATAREVASRGITVNAVAPGFITTELTADLPDAIKEGVKAQTPLGRFGEPQEIAAAVVYLASREASYVTGQVLGVDGGLVMM